MCDFFKPWFLHLYVGENICLKFGREGKFLDGDNVLKAFSADALA